MYWVRVVRGNGDTHIETIITAGFSESRVDWEVWQCEQPDYKVGERERERERERYTLVRITMCVLYKIYSLQLFVTDTFYLSNKS